MPIFAALPAIGSAIAAAAPTIGTLAGVGSSIYGAVNSAGAVNGSTQAQLQAAQQAEQDLSPWMNGGQSALAAQMELLGLGGGAGGSYGQPNYAAYVQNNPDLLALYQSQQGMARGKTMDQFGQEHWQGYGQGENRPYTPFTASGGANGTAANGQQSAIDALKASPLYQSLFHNGEQTVLADAAATGGLRGGNAEASLYNLGNDTLAKVIQNQFDNLNTISGMGENAAAKVGNTQLLGGQIAGGGITSAADANNNLANTITSAVANPNLLKIFGLGGGIPTSTSNILGPSYNIAANSVPQLNLDTSLPQLAF